MKNREIRIYISDYDEQKVRINMSDYAEQKDTH